MGNAPWSKELFYQLLFEVLAVSILIVSFMGCYTLHKINQRIGNAEVIVVKIGTRI